MWAQGLARAWGYDLAGVLVALENWSALAMLAMVSPLAMALGCWLAMVSCLSSINPHQHVQSRPQSSEARAEDQHQQQCRT